MDRFSAKSCWLTFRWMVRSERSAFLSMFLGLVLGFVFCEEGIMLPAAFDPNASPQMWGVALFFSLALGLVWMMYGASRMFVAFKKKQSAITLLMHPASNIEKFVARWLCCVVLWGLLTLAAFVLGDALRYGFNIAMGWRGVDTDLPLFFRAVRGATAFDWYGSRFKEVFLTCFFVMLTVALHSIYILGSVLLRRHRFLITSLFSIAFMVMVEACGDSLNVGMYDMNTDDVAGAVFEFFILFVVTVLCYWLSFRLFVRSQIISNKWLNV